MPIVTVVIPFYSSIKGLLGKSVKSALAQSFTDIEVIVVDDCSPVSAKDELSALFDSRLKIIRHEKNCNGAIARNSGIDAASSEYVAFLDYDDVWYPDKLKMQLALFKQAQINNKNPVIYSRCKIIDGKRQMVRPIRAIEHNEPVGDYLFCARQIIQTSGIFLKTEVAKIVRFDDLKRHQDYQFCLSLECYGCKFFMMKEPTYEFPQIPKKNDNEFSSRWLQIYSVYLTPKAIHGFKSLVLLRAMIESNSFHEALIFSLRNKMLIIFAKQLSILFIKKFLLFIKVI